MDYSTKLDLIGDEPLRQLLPERVASSLPVSGVKGFSVSDDASDTAACAAKYGIPLEDCANTIVVRYRKGGQEHHAAIVSLASRRIDVNGALRTALQAQRVSFAGRDFVVDSTGMEYGGVTAFGLPEDWRVIVDTTVVTRANIVMGAGIRAAKLLMSPAVLAGLPNASVHAIAAEDRDPSDS